MKNVRDQRGDCDERSTHEVMTERGIAKSFVAYARWVSENAIDLSETLFGHDSMIGRHREEMARRKPLGWAAPNVSIWIKVEPQQRAEALGAEYEMIQVEKTIAEAWRFLYGQHPNLKRERVKVVCDDESENKIMLDWLIKKGAAK